MTGKPSDDEESSKNQETTDQNFLDILEKSDQSTGTKLWR